MIDIHCHVGKLYFDPFIDPELVLSWMDKYDVRKAALHPIENPEETAYYVTTWYILCLLYTSCSLRTLPSS